MFWFRPILAAFVSTLLLAPCLVDLADAQGRGPGRGRVETAGPPQPGGAMLPLGQRGGQEPAYARGYADGFERGQADARRGDRYDPANSREYRDADNGYSGTYGSRDAYRTNYRAGFRRGYDEGYRSASR